jgi:hypothetical protein
MPDDVIAHCHSDLFASFDWVTDLVVEDQKKFIDSVQLHR